MKFLSEFHFYGMLVGMALQRIFHGRRGREKDAGGGMVSASFLECFLKGVKLAAAAGKRGDAPAGGSAARRSALFLYYKKIIKEL